MNPLYGMAPVGVGGAHVESLSGYITRLAGEHCVRPERLLREVVEHCPEVGRGVLDPHFFAIDSRSVDGLGRYAGRLSRALEQLTGRGDLRHLTMLRWSGLLDRTGKGMFRLQRAWCPRCLLEQLAAGLPVYERLIWRFRAATTCDVHGVRLRERCVACGSPQPMIPRLGATGLCSVCDAFLGLPGECAEERSRAPPTDERWSTAALQGMLRRHGGKRGFGVRARMLERMEAAWRRPGVKDGARKQVRRMYAQWRTKGCLPTLAGLFRFAMATRTQPVWLLDGVASDDGDPLEVDEAPG